MHVSQQAVAGWWWWWVFPFGGAGFVPRSLSGEPRQVDGVLLVWVSPCHFTPPYARHDTCELLRVAVRPRASL